MSESTQDGHDKKTNEVFNEAAKQPPVELGKAFREAHQVPAAKQNFKKAARDKLQGRLSTPVPTLSPNGAPPVRGAKRVSVAEKKVPAGKLPDTAAKKETGPTQTFNRVGRHRKEAQEKKREQAKHEERAR